MRKNIFISACLLSATLLCIPSFARANDAYFDCTSDTISVNGEIEGSSLGESASLFIAPTGNDLFMPVLSDMFYMERDLEFSCDIHLHPSFAPSKYEIRAGSENSLSPYKGTVVVFDENSSDIKTLIDKINECESASELTDLMKSDGKDKLFDIDSEYFEDALKLCFKLKTQMPNKKYTASDFVYAYYYSCAASMMHDAVAPDSVMKVYYRFFDTTYTGYADSEFKDEIDALCLEIDFGAEMVTMSSIEILAELRSFDNAGNLRVFVEDNYENAGISESVMKKYRKLSINYQNKVFAALIKKIKDCTSILEFAELFEDCVNDQINASEKKTTSSGGSSGGASGSSFGGAVVSPPFQNQVSVPVNDTAPTPEPDKKEIVFSDMENHWSKDDVYALASKGIIDGYSDSTFRPDGYVTRAELSKLIANAFEFPKSEILVLFEDVNKNDWYYDSVAALAEAGIIKGDGTDFRPNSFITRQDAAVMISRTLDYHNIKSDDKSLDFDDKNIISDYALIHVDALSSLGIINGSGNCFYPVDNLTRGEISAIINRAYKIYGGAEK